MIRVLLALVTCSTALSAQSFEGEIQMQLSGAKPGDAPRSMAYATRRGAVRLTAAGMPGGVVMLIPTGERTLYMLLPAQQSYVEAPVPATKAPDGPVPVVKRTGRTETIAGVSCEHVTVGLANGVADVCLTTALGPWLNPLRSVGQAAGGAATLWEQALGADGFPLKVVLPDGTVSMEVVKVERKRLAPALFEIPSTYVKMTMPARR